MKTLYLDLFSGISGDMFLGALIDIGVPAAQLECELAKLNLHGYHLHVYRSRKGSIEGVKVDVHVASDHDHSRLPETHTHPHPETQGRTFSEIRKLIADSALTDWVKQKAIAVFQRIADAEGKIHGVLPEQVHFHEVGAVDSIVDISGACVALDLLGKPRLMAGAVVEGTGFVECAHGRFPVPAPATLAILGARGIAVSQCDEPTELVTPTGAALLAELVESFGPIQGLVAEKIGYGLGTRENKTRPNVLRAVLGEAKAQGTSTGARAAPHDWETDTVAVLETNLDDISAELVGAFMTKALAAGALDVFHTPVHMKKNRPGVLLTVLCAEAEADTFAEMLLRETSAFGLRRYVAERRKLRRQFVTVQTPYGAVTVKVGKLDGKVLQVAPEFESCRKLADQAQVPVRSVYEEALRAFAPSLLK